MKKNFIQQNPERKKKFKEKNMYRNTILAPGQKAR